MVYRSVSAMKITKLEISAKKKKFKMRKLAFFNWLFKFLLCVRRAALTWL